jgi:Na+-driven multidrug efflux pump
MEVGAGGLRSINRPIPAMLNSLVGVCVFRIVWVYTAFKASPSIDTLYLSYPFSWLFAAALHIMFFAFFFTKLRKEV